MRIKKVNELMANEYSEKELNDFRSKTFGDKDIVYHVWGEGLKYTVPEYHKITTLYSVQDCIDWYNKEKRSKFSFLNNFDNILFIKETKEVEILDFELLLNTNKYNL